MKKVIFFGIISVMLLAVVLSGCQNIGDAFKINPVRKPATCKHDKHCSKLICPMVVGGDKPKCDIKIGTCYCGGVCGDGYCDIVEKRDRTCYEDCMWCSDGTLYGKCAILKPKYCDNGQLVDRCSACGCPTGYECLDNGSCIPPGEPLMIHSGEDLKLVKKSLIAPFSNNLLIERENQEGWSSHIYELDGNNLYLKSSIPGYINEVISYSKDGASISEWILFSTKSNTDKRIDKIWRSTSLTGPWVRDYDRERGFCYQESPCAPENDSAELAGIQYFQKDLIDGEFVMASLTCQPHFSLDMMNSWLSPFRHYTTYTGPAETSYEYVYYGGECPLDDAFAARVSLSRDEYGNVINVSYQRVQSLWSPAEELKIGNRKVRDILKLGNDFIIYSGEGWIGKAPQLFTAGNWQFPVFHNYTKEYLYSRGIIQVQDLIIVYGFDTRKCFSSECIQLKISKDYGDSFISAENNLRNELGSLLPDTKGTLIGYMESDSNNNLIYIVISNLSFEGNDILFSIPYNKVRSWVS
ncbi:hypothetical protein AYK26_01995 [Euryarchaeota archaeon SM23-78]|nr:MAG: hypothetical protein AYK26_01995 [Euryarchaeota archaeon SM23-78]MBW3000309.1 hypothetical protein [Candidatus Woesearchaeota archaeon]